MTTRNSDLSLVSRRVMLSWAGGLVSLLPTCRTALAQTEAAPLTDATDLHAADPAPLLPSQRFNDAFDKIVGNGTPIEGQMTIEMPEDAENGNIVPYKISVDNPMTETDYIDKVYLLSTQNPQALVATFFFTPLSGTATVGGRMRLAKTQEVIAVGLTNENRLLIARTTVQVGIGGCGVE